MGGGTARAPAADRAGRRAGSSPGSPAPCRREPCPAGRRRERSSPGTRLPLDEDLVADIAAGRIASAAWEGRGGICGWSGWSTRPRRAGVLAVSRRTPFDRRASDVVTHTAQVDRAAAAGAARRPRPDAGCARATADLRLAILQLLMVEDTVAARRVAAGLWPGLLDTDTACVYVLEGFAEERDRLAEECLDVTEEQALVVRCPAMDGHVIVVTPEEAAGDGPAVARRPHARTPSSAAASGRAWPAPPPPTGRRSAPWPWRTSGRTRRPSTPNAPTPSA